LHHAGNIPAVVTATELTGGAQTNVIATPVRCSRVRSVLATLRVRLRPQEYLFVVFMTALAIVVAATRQWGIVDHQLLLDFRFVGIVAGVALLIACRGYARAPQQLSRGDRWRSGGRLGVRTIREFGPLFFTLATYEILHDLTPVLRPITEDHLLVASDHFFLHVDVGMWLDTHIGSTAMTHIMVACYLSYAFASPIYAGVQYLRGNYRAFHDFALAITITAFLGFSGYLLLPAVGPYIYQHAVYSSPLPGWGHGGVMDVLGKMQGTARDAFPSLHTAMTTVVLGNMWRDARKMFWAYLPIALGLYVSTMYLRVHYATDVAAGFIVGFFALWAAPKINRWWYARPNSATAAPAIPEQREPVEASS
jgi:membrane-associated phospholipid phosphatase